MRNAPLVMYPVGRFLGLYWLCAALVLVGAALTFWLVSEGQIGRWIAVISIVTWLVIGVASFPLIFRKNTASWLVWNGQDWRCLDSGRNEIFQTIASVVVILDVQKGLLLQLIGTSHNASMHQWVWLYKGFAPAGWHGLRCAVYSRQHPTKTA
jgi:hypothetical protein